MAVFCYNRGILAYALSPDTPVITFLRIFLWPIILLAVFVGGEFVRADFWPMLWAWYTSNVLQNTLLLITIWYAGKYLKFNMRFWYAWAMSGKLVAMKVLLPRTDSKIDQEKRTEKDFKEKIAIMEQLYRALWEVRSLTFWQLVHFWIFRFNTMSFEFYLDHGELLFFIVAHPHLISIIEKQVTAFYPDAEVTVQKTPEIWPKGTKLVGYNMLLKKPYYFPLRFYEEMQDDPLNDLANVLSKMGADEMSAIQIILTPTFSDRWSKKLRKYANTKFKGKEDGILSKIPILGSLIEVVGGIAAAAVLYIIAHGHAGFDATTSGFAANGYGEHSPGGYSLQSAIVI